MATTTGAVLRQKLSEILGDYRTFTATSGSTTTAVTLALQNYSAANDDFKGMWWLGTGPTNNLRTARRISASTYSSGTLTWLQAATAVVNNDTFELHKYDPTELHTALTYGIRDTYPTLYLPIRDETLYVDNLLSNNDFETFAAGAFTSWTSFTTPTIAQETSRVWHGSNSASITGGASAGGLYQDIWNELEIRDAFNKTVTFKAWVWTNAASQARLQLQWTGAQIDSGSYHVGNSSWELLTVSAVPNSAATLARCRCISSAGALAYFDSAYAYVDDVNRYTIPTSIINGPHEVLAQRDINQPLGDYSRFKSHPSSGKILRLLGMGRLSVPTTDAGTTEVDGTRADLIAWKAAEFFWNNRWAQTQNEADRAKREDARIAVAELMRTPGVRMGQPTAEIPQGWSVEEDNAGNRYLLIP